MAAYAAILAGLDTAYKIGTGINQGIKARKLEKGLGERPIYTPPSAATMALENARAQAQQQKFPGQEAAEERLGASASNAYRISQEGASSSAGLLAAAAAINANEQAGIVDLGVKGAEFQSQNQQRLNESLMSYAGYQDKAFEYNEALPYQEKTAAIEALKGASRENVATGVQGGLTAAYSLGNKNPVSGTPSSTDIQSKLTAFDAAKRAGYKGSFADYQKYL